MVRREHFAPARGYAPDIARFALALALLPVGVVMVAWERWKSWRMLPRRYNVERFVRGKRWT